MAGAPLSQIPTLALLYKLNKLAPASPTSLSSTATSKYNDKIALIRTDITKLEVDAIVNAANESLLGGGGVDGAIHRAAGPQLIEECETLNGCRTGSAKITKGYRLPAKKVIHAVGPVYSSTKARNMHTQLLSGCYATSLDLAVQNDCKSIAFSALSTGVYGYPSDEAAETAIRAVKGWLDEDEARAEKLERIVFCNFMEKDERAYQEYLSRYFPPSSEDETSKEDDEASMKEGDEGETPLPDLPDVPKNDPTEEGQPDSKRTKLDDGVGMK